MQTPRLTVDVIIRIPNQAGEPGILLIERKNFPTGLALPGGFVDLGETVAAAALREAREEVGLEVELEHLLGVYSSPARDPRFHTVSVVFVGRAGGTPQAGSDAQQVRWVAEGEIPSLKLLFDHTQILQDYLKYRSHPEACPAFWR